MNREPYFNRPLLRSTKAPRLTWVIFLFVFFAAGCQDQGATEIHPPVSEEKISLTPLTQDSDIQWSMGPFTQGRLHLSIREPGVPKRLTIFNAEMDSVDHYGETWWKHLPTDHPASVTIRWNTDAALLTVLHADTICLQRILPFSDNLGIKALHISEATLTVDSLDQDSQIPDPADVRIAYWGTALGPDHAAVSRPWNAILAEMIHSQGIFLRMFGQNFSPEFRKPHRLSDRHDLERILSRRPDFCIISGGTFEQQRDGGPGIPEFRETLSSVLNLVTASGTQPILLVLPPMPASASQKDKDLRAAYNDEMRSIAMNQGASVVDLWDRFRSRGEQASVLQDQNGILTQEGHELIASELSTLLQYYLQFTQRQ